MLHIILLILKIIGIVLLCILGTVILAVACVLFVPVRYQVRLDREEGEGRPPFEADVRVTWLLHLVNILVRYPADVIVRARVMVFTLFKIPGEEKKDGKEAGEQAGKTDREENPPETSADTDAAQQGLGTARPPAEDGDEASGNSTGKAEDGSLADAKRPSGLPETQETDAVQQETDTAQQEPDAAETEKISLSGKILGIIDTIRQAIEKIKSLFENIQYTIRKFCDKIKSVLDNIEYYRGVLESEPFRQSWQLCRGELYSVFRKLKPDRFEAQVIVGMDDPAVTGQILAIYGILYPFIWQNIQVAGDFERTHIEGAIYIRGKIRAFTFLKAAIRIYFNKDIRKLIKLFKKKKKEAV